MTKNYTILFILCILLLSVNMLQAKMLIRIHNYPLDELHRDLDIAGAKRGEWIDVVIDEKDFLDFAHLKTEVLIEDLESFYSFRKGEYHYYSEFVDSLETIALNHSDIAMLDTLGTTYEGREILALKVSDNVALDEDEPELLFIGLHHAREWPSLEICLFYADTLTRAYGVDLNVTQAVDSCEIWIIPCMNPDGYVWCHDQDHDWRKNRRYFPESGTYGVDLNRNYDGANNGDPLGEWGSIPSYSTTHNPSSSIYCGPSPFSEAETKVIRDLILAHNFIFGVSYHTYGEMVMWQWGYTSRQPDDAQILSDIGEKTASRIATQNGIGTYDAYQSAGLYPTSGDFGDWSYGFSLYTGGKNLLAYTVEACSTFHPPASELDQIVRENFNGALYICEIADSIAALLTPKVMPPELAELDTSYTGSYTVVWSQKNPTASPDHYQLDELSGFTALTDNAESGSTLWSTDQFTVNSSRYHSPGNSYFSNLSSGNDVSSMTTRWPLLVSTQDSLSFWCWYDIEENWDYAYVEVSMDGRKWDILDEFTGSSGWVRKTYPLEAYTERSIFLRFRYITDDYVENPGLWVDDIYPVADFNTSTTLDSTIPDTAYTIDWRPSGHYYYRVRGHNDTRGWGDWSQLQDMVATFIPEYGCGDCNGDSCINFLDISYLSDYISLAGPAPLGSGDVNQDGFIDVNDLIYLTSYLFDYGPPPCGDVPPFCSLISSLSDSVGIGNAEICCSTTTVSLPITLKNSSTLIGMTFALKYATGLVVCDSAKFNGTLFQSWSQESRIDSSSGTILLAVWTPSLVTPYHLSPGTYEAATLWFSSLVPPDAQDTLSGIDTTFILPDHKLSLVNDNQTLLKPAVATGAFDIAYHCGDVNADCRITGADATYLLVYIYRGGSTPICEADVNGDGRITGADATYIINYIYYGEAEPCNPVVSYPPVMNEKHMER